MVLHPQVAILESRDAARKEGRVCRAATLVEMRRPLLAGAVVAGLAAPVAGAALLPVPLTVQRAIDKRTRTLAYVPARVPFGFRYARWSYTAGARPAVRIWFQRRGKPAAWQIAFVATPQRGTCPRGEKSYQVDGNKVWWSHTANEQQAWRCVTGPGGLVRLTAATPLAPTAFAAVGLAQVAAAGHRIR